MHDREELGGPGERHVERPHALRLLLEDAGRVDHHGGVELEALDDADRHHGDLVVEALLDGDAVIDPNRGERRRAFVDPRGRADHGHVAVVDRSDLVAHRLGDGGTEVVGRCDPAELRRPPSWRTDTRRQQVGCRVGQHLGGQVHVGPGDAVADGELARGGRAGDRAAATGSRSSPRAPRRRWTGRCRPPRSSSR